jgi:DNA-directed RNA polymerase subunit beta'
MYQCGLPKGMAVELFKPFVMQKLVQRGHAQNIKSAKKMVEKLEPRVWDVLEEVIQQHPVLLNRAPTLHRLGIQAFEPILVEGKAIKLHPLVCTAYNADFDGDQMAVHVPLSVEAQSEARFLMLAANNILKPQDGSPVVSPTQDMILGSYYMTTKKEGVKGEGSVFKDIEEMEMAYNTGAVELHAVVKVRIVKEIDGEQVSRIVEGTVGRFIFNQNIPQDLGFVKRETLEEKFQLEVDQQVSKKTLSQIVEKCYKVHGPTDTSIMLDKIKALGFHFSTKGAITVGVSDMEVPETKPELLAKADKKIDENIKRFRRGLITEEERYNNVVKIWNQATEEVTDALMDHLDPLNPINMMANSGARGSRNQIRQLAAMRGLMANPSGRIIELPIRSNFREGLNVLEFFISTHGARKGLADTALRTADSGYLTRRLVDVSQDVIVREEDCGSTTGYEVKALNDNGEIIEDLRERLVGRYTTDAVIHPQTKEVIVEEDSLILEDMADEIVAAGIESVMIRSVFNCDSKIGVCAKCYGVNLTTWQPVDLGEAVGTVAAQSIGEPGTQLTMRTFHTGGVASAADITQGLPRIEELFEARKPKGLAIISEIAGKVEIKETKKKKEAVITSDDEKESKTYLIPYGSRLKVDTGDFVDKGGEITEGSINPNDILKILGPHSVQHYILQEVQKVYRLQGVHISDKHVEVIIRQMLRKIKVDSAGDTNLLAGSTVDMFTFRSENEEAAKKGLEPATGNSVLLGITKASLATDSFLSAASFQETTRVLTDAAIKGKVDPLLGLKENVIIGKLIPAGTGMPQYNDVTLYYDPPKEEGADEYDDLLFGGEQHLTLEETIVDDMLTTTEEKTVILDDKDETVDAGEATDVVINDMLEESDSISKNTEKDTGNDIIMDIDFLNNEESE